MSTNGPAGETFHAGRLVARRLKASGIDTVFTLSGGHLFSIYDGCRSEGIRLVDTRHEQTAAFAAEGWSKVTRQPGVAALTAGPGVTNGMSAMAAAQQNCSPLLVLGGRAPALRWGMGSLQEIDHVPFVAPLTRFAATAPSAEAVNGLVDEALRATVGAPSGVAFVDFPMDHVFSAAADDGRPGALTDLATPPRADGDALEQAAGLLAAAQRPVIMAGTNVWWGHAEAALLRLAEQRRIPVLMNGMARGTVPADHPLAFSRARSKALAEADVAVVVGVPMDFRLGFGGVFGPETQLIVADRAQPDRDHPRPIAAGLYGDLSATLAALGEATPAGHDEWVADLRAAETTARDREHADLADDRSPPNWRHCWTATRSSLSTPVISAPTRAASSTAMCRARGSTAARSVASDRVLATRWPPNWLGPNARSSCCKATAPSGSAGWNGTHWSGTTCRWSR
jgi:acetolactate synthase I/II/III large subunit